MELKSTCHTIRQFEPILKELVKNKMAEVAKDVTVDKANGEKQEVRVYQVFVGEDAFWRVNIRVWYDTEYDRASIKMTQEGVDMLLHSATVMSLMFMLGQKVSKNGHGINMDELEALIKKATLKVTGKEENIEISKD
jgi:hypothetical protein